MCASLYNFSRCNNRKEGPIISGRPRGQANPKWNLKQHALITYIFSAFSTPYRFFLIS